MTISYTRRWSISFSFLAILWFLPVATAGNQDTSSANDAPKYTLRYQFHPGEVLRWNVVHRQRVRTTYGGWTQTTDSVTRSTKCWHVTAVDEEGNAVFESMVEDAVFENRMETIGKDKKKPKREKVRYDSRKDEKPPRAFEASARRVGKPLARIKLDSRGVTLKRTPLFPESAPVATENPELTIPLPDEPIAVGESWRRPHKAMLRLENGTTKTILTQQVFTLVSVKTGIATIEVVTQILTPVHNPEVEAKLIEQFSRSTIRFDVDAGRVLWQQRDLDHRVVGFRGPESCLHYLTRSAEKLLASKADVAQQTKTSTRK
ncbi:MAG: hypothetical protein JW888_08200 [Pirellulales bacterium]|nr:hypothetical protein [Pirellulales bacterium]